MLTTSCLSHLECPKCGLTYDADAIQHLCSCGSPLLVRYDMKKLSAVKKESLAGRPDSFWRYQEFLPVRDDVNVTSLGESVTPLLSLPVMGASLGMTNLLMKDEGLLPTGTFKCRGAAVGVSRARELGVSTLTMPTNGNAGAAWSLYSARAGLQACIVMPEDAPYITRNECAVSGADLYLVRGLISDAGRITARAVDRYGWYDASTLKEPYRIEGKKTMGLEIVEQLGWQVPDVILYPTGGGVGIIGIYKALLELREIGWIGEKLPRLVSVQASGCAPIVKAWKEKKSESDMWPDSTTVAFGINVPKALGDFLVLEAIYKTEGCAVEVEDAEILRAQSELASKEGTYICPEGAATLAATIKLLERGRIQPDEKVVLLNTGTGLIYPDTVEVNAVTLDPDDDLPEKPA